MDNNREKDFVSFYLGINLLHDELDQSCDTNEAYEKCNAVAKAFFKAELDEGNNNYENWQEKLETFLKTYESKISEYINCHDKTRVLNLFNEPVYEIWQIKNDLNSSDSRYLRFSSFEYLKRKNLDFSFDNYECVYSGIDCETSEEIYTKYNSSDMPFDFTGHSLSVSDVIVFKENDEVLHADYVDAFGMKDVTEEAKTYFKAIPISHDHEIEEAVNRMNRLCIAQNIKDEFRENKNVMVSHEDGSVSECDEETKKLISRIEQEKNITVYHVVESTIGLGEKQCKVSYLLDVGNDEEEEDWYWERHGWEQGIVSSVYGYNWDEPWRSEFGSITVSPNGDGGLFNDGIGYDFETAFEFQNHSHNQMM